MKIQVKLWILFIGIIFFYGCSGSVRHPRFITFIETKHIPPKLIEKTQQPNNTVLLIFEGSIDTITVNLVRKKDSTNILYKEERSILNPPNEQSDKTGMEQIRLQITPLDHIEIGEEFFLVGAVTSPNKDTFDFSIDFTGRNTNPAVLQISEIRPLYSSKKRTEFIEFVVKKAGNLGGLELLNVGDKKNPNYIFPTSEVHAGEYIVYHYRKIDDKNQDEISTDIISTGKESCKHARDFWGPYKSISKRTDNAVILRNPLDSSIQDAVLYFITKDAAPDPSRKWKNSEISSAAKAAANAKCWKPDDNPNNAVLFKITPSKSIGRKSLDQITHTANDWVLFESKYVTPGQPNN